MANGFRFSLVINLYSNFVKWDFAGRLPVGKSVYDSGVGVKEEVASGK
jgi:hypothetical protein